MGGTRGAWAGGRVMPSCYTSPAPVHLSMQLHPNGYHIQCSLCTATTSHCTAHLTLRNLSRRSSALLWTQARKQQKPQLLPPAPAPPTTHYPVMARARAPSSKQLSAWLLARELSCSCWRGYLFAKGPAVPAAEQAVQAVRSASRSHSARCLPMCRKHWMPWSPKWMAGCGQCWDRQG